ncbi:PKD domain-containing protein [Lewinella sp. LCG006]|uniref:PKD domain-containing protein n=1 Tax=Lewinella sp. LCG006 TaxID=3231911 RepID=UPI00345F914D
MSRIYISLVCTFLFFVPKEGKAQFHDNHWMMGYNGGSASEPNDSFGISILSFYNGELAIENNQDIDLEFDGAGSAFSRFSGDLLYFSNGIEIRNFDNDLVVDGNFGGEAGDIETLRPQSFIFLPLFTGNNPLLSFVRMRYTNDSPRLGKEVLSSKIDGSLNGDIGLVYEKDQRIVYDSLATSGLTACKHANGRDWWVLVPRADQNIVYSILVSPNSVHVVDTMYVELPMANGLGQSTFTPDGTKYIRLNLVEFDTPEPLDIFDFDRCTGQLTNHRQTSVGTDAWAGGIAVSISSQYLYVSHYNHVFQYDLWAEDIFSTKDTVATYDGYLEWNFFHSRFFQAQLAPDGKIYLNCSSGVKVLHVINQPDEGGLACDLVQHDIHLPNNNAFTLANHPNYRLGPIDGSPCDTLGIDNLPRAYYRIDRNPEDTLDFHFQDLSFYEPDTWAWTFGDGGMSTDRHPDHTYASPGIYEVCLTVSNDLGSDTDCRILELGPVAVDDHRHSPLLPFPIQYKMFWSLTLVITIHSTVNSGFTILLDN